MIKALDILRELNMASVMLRLVLAMFFGGMIGMERGRKRRPAGFRTYMLVSLGATLTMLLGQYCWKMSAGQTDVARFGAQVINGIGFLGAGTVLVTAKQEVKGLTTAAGLWASACMGLAVGAGFYECVILGFVLIFFAVRVLPRLENYVIEKARNMNLYVEFQSLDDVPRIISCLKAQNVHIHEVEIDRGRDRQNAYPSAVFALRLRKGMLHAQVLSAVSGIDRIVSMEEI